MKQVFCRVLIKNQRNNLLVVQDRGDVWNFPGGKQELDETPAECAKREVCEEIGLDVRELTEVYRGLFRFGEVEWDGHFYFADVVDGVPVVQELHKITGLQFVDHSDAVKFPPELTDAIRHAFESPTIQARMTSWMGPWGRRQS